MPRLNRVNLKLTNRTFWKKFHAGYARGSAYSGGRLLTALELSKRVGAVRSFDDFVALLRDLNGFYALVRATDDAVFVSVDHLRSFPLFYAIQGDAIFVSDDSYWVHTQVGDERIDETSATEFLLAGYVTGNDTLTPKVKQLQAGEAVALTSTSNGVRSERIRFYDFGHASPIQESFEQLLSKSNSYIEGAFTRMLEVADHRTLVVPLSGGVDSRLVLLMLKRLGSSAVITFSYGRAGNPEAKISRKVASALDVPWEFVTYTNQAWSRWYHSAEWKAYSRFASSLSSTPHLQDWPAVWELKRKHLIPENSLFVPGHFAAPTYYSPDGLTDWLKSKSITADELANAIRREFYYLQDWQNLEASIQQQVTTKIKNVLQPSLLTTEQAIRYWDRWWWENSAKFTANSLRAYEFWGYGWWLPFWDLELVRFWRTLPISLRLRKKLHIAFVKNVEMGITKRPPIPDTSHRPSTTPTRILKKLHLLNWVREIRSHGQYDRHAYAWYGIMPKHEFNRAFHGEEDINSYLANQTLRSLFPSWQIPQGLDILAKSERVK